MRKILLSLSYLSLVTISTAQSTIFQWAKSISNANGRSITVDASGNTYFTGQFTGTTDFDPSASTFNMTSVGSDDVYITKFDGAGNFVWAKSIGGTSDDYGMSIDLDGSGNVYVAGIFQNTVDFDPSASSYTLASNGGEDIYICKLNSSGSFVWAKGIGGSTGDNAWDCYVDGLGNVYTTGFFNGTVDFDPSGSVSNLTAGAGYNAFISKLDASGNFAWAKSFSGGLNISFSIKSDASGNVYTTGKFINTVDFDPSGVTYNMTSSSSGISDAFISKLDASGNFVWAKAIGGANDDVGNAIGIDASGNVYTTGEFASTVDFDPGAGTYTLASGGGTNVYISKLDASGNFVWAKALLGSTYATTNDLKIDASNNVYTIGWYGNTTDFDPGAASNNLTPVGGYDIFILKLDASGNFTWANSFGGSSSDSGFSIDIDASNNIYSTGSFFNTVDFDPSASVLNLTGTPGGAFIHKMGPCVPPSPPTNTTPVEKQTICAGNSSALSVSGVGAIYWHSTPAGASVVTIGSIYNTPVLSTGTYTYYVEAVTCTVSATRTAINLTVSECTEVKEFSLANTSNTHLYPNPSDNVIYIEANKFENTYEVEIINTLGEILIKKQQALGTINIDISQLAAGIYYAKITQDNKQQSIKLIKQ